MRITPRATIIAVVEVPAGYRQIRVPHGLAFVRDDLAAVPWTAWWAPGQPLPGLPGRGTVVSFEPARGLTAVGRDYRRGGALRALCSRRFARPSRALRELATLASLRQRGVRAVEPLAAVCRRGFGWWEMRLVTAWVPGASPLPAFVKAEPRQARAAVAAAGSIVKEAWDAGLTHRDLHPDNLLATLASGQVAVWLVDLDRAVLGGSVEPAARDRMVLRLARYLERHRIPVRAGERVSFLAGLGLDRAQRRSELLRLSALYERAVWRHRLWRRLRGER